MTSAAVKPARGTGGRHGEGYALIIFASVLLLTVGSFNLIDGIAAIARSHVFFANAHYVVGDLRSWGWVVLILGALQLLAGLEVLAGKPVGTLVRGGRDRAERHRPGVLHPRLPVLFADDHRRGRGSTLGAVRVWQPPGNNRLVRQPSRDFSGLAAGCELAAGKCPGTEVGVSEIGLSAA
jgi:hypothetical protein